MSSIETPGGTGNWGRQTEIGRERRHTTSNRLFLDDSHVLEFTARVVERRKESGRYLIALSETAFYPTSGGQPNDTGTIAGVPVLDVHEEGDQIFHLLDAPLEQENEVACAVDWPRRHDHMQQHTGQHILSQALLQVCDTPTVWFAIGPDWSTIALERKPDSDALHQALLLANSIIDENRPIEVLFPTDAELSTLPVRGVVAVDKNVRIVRIDGFDWSPCGGTHCKTTGDVRMIGIRGTRTEKGQYRVEFVCGRRAESLFLENASTVTDVAALLDVGPVEVVDRTRSLLEKLRARERELTELREARLSSDLVRLTTEAKNADSSIIATILDNRTIQEIRQLAHKLVEEGGLVALLVGRDGDKIGLAFARSEDRSEDMNQVMMSVCHSFGCRGGGNPAFATGGGGRDVDAERVLQTAKNAL